jgi:glutamine amidotransferase
MIHPIIDEYYVYNPYHSRSSKFAVGKGLVTNEKSPSPRAATPIAIPGLIPEDLKKHLPPSKMQQENVFKNLTPEMHSPLAIRTLPSDASLRSHSENGSNTLLDIHRVAPLPARDPARPQEQGNMKKKRRSLVAIEPVVQAGPEHIERPSTPERASYGDPAKIARFFPELNLSS